MIRSAVPI